LRCVVPVSIAQVRHPCPGGSAGSQDLGGSGRQKGGGGAQLRSGAWGQGMAAACLACTPSPGAGLALKLGGIRFSPANFTSVGQFAGILGVASLPGPTRSLLGSWSLAWGEQNCDRYGRQAGETQSSRQTWATSTRQSPFSDGQHSSVASLVSQDRILKQKAINALQESREPEPGSSPGVGRDLKTAPLFPLRCCPGPKLCCPHPSAGSGHRQSENITPLLSSGF